MAERCYIRAGNASRMLVSTNVPVMKWPSTPYSSGPCGNDRHDFAWATWAPQWSVLVAQCKVFPPWVRRQWLNAIMVMTPGNREDIGAAIEAAHLLGGNFDSYIEEVLGDPRKEQAASWVLWERANG